MNKFYFAQFYWYNDKGQIVPMLASDGVMYLDGRKSEWNKLADASIQAEKLSKFKKHTVTHVSLHYGNYSNNVTTMAITKVAQ